MRSLAVPPARYVLGFDSRRDGGFGDDSPVWRYMDLTKLLSLLEHRALFFTRADRLGDAYEGAITAHRHKLRQEYVQRQRRRGRPTKLNRDAQSLVETAIQNTLVSCWHANEHESAAMWKLYLSSGEGVAVRSTVGRLMQSLPPPAARGKFVDGWQSILSIQMEPVRYIDYASAQVGYADMLLYKRKSFEHERELRLLIHDDSMQNEPRPSRFPVGGDYVPVKLDRLIEAIHVAPSAPAWLMALVNAVVRKRYRFEFNVCQSALAASPLH